MKTHTDVQIIKQNGMPAFAVLPYEYYLEITGQRDEDEKVYIPNEVIMLQFINGLSLIAAWRTHKGLSQQELAEKMGVTQPAVAQMEKEGAKPRKATLEKAAKALGINVEHLTD